MAYISAMSFTFCGVSIMRLVIVLLYTLLQLLISSAVDDDDLLGEEYFLNTYELGDPNEIEIEKLSIGSPYAYLYNEGFNKLNVASEIEKYNISQNLEASESKTSSKIIGGQLAQPFDFPYQVAILIVTYRGNTFCGGSLISPEYILTASHCIFARPQRILVLLGNENLKVRSKYEVRVDVDRYTRHRNYDPVSLKNDICVLHLRKSIKYTFAIYPISLPTYKDVKTNYLNKIAIVSGFGHLYDGGQVSSKLMYLWVRIIDNYMCRRYFEDNNVELTNICTSGHDGRGACHGDSGGPLVVNNVVVGIVSFGSSSCTSGFPTVYTRVPQYLRWIAANTNINIES